MFPQVDEPIASGSFGSLTGLRESLTFKHTAEEDPSQMPQHSLIEVPGNTYTDPWPESGDISLYKYCFKSVGLFLTAVFLLLTAAVAALGRMPRKSR